jgi:hypothetical protein
MGRGSLTCLVGLAVALCGAGLAAATPSREATALAAAASPLRSRLLWATINVCNPVDQPDWVGIRGSMPGDGHRGDSMFMGFHLQFLKRATGRWVDLARTPPPGFIGVGNGASGGQGGESFLVMPVVGKAPSTFRGLVEFKWRRGKTVVASGWRLTTAGRSSAARGDPKGFSAATCQIG